MEDFRKSLDALDKEARRLETEAADLRLRMADMSGKWFAVKGRGRVIDLSSDPKRKFVWCGEPCEAVSLYMDPDTGVMLTFRPLSGEDGLERNGEVCTEGLPNIMEAGETLPVNLISCIVRHLNSE